MSRKALFTLCILAFGAGQLSAQERRIPLQFNARLESPEAGRKSVQKAGAIDLLELPFFDDFARTSALPDERLWADRNVFVNSNFPVNPRSVGVATFDALDANGSLYPNASSIRFGADTLTSLPIQLEYPASDSIYLSFFIQPQGLGDAPEKYDSLLLEFFAPLQKTWISRGGFQGSALQPFRQVFFPVTDTAFLHSGFRLRFVNLASLAASAQDPGKIDNDDHWHIDYVRLDKNRSYNDSLIDDVAFVSPLSSLLYTYESVPWLHYPLLANKIVRPYLNLSYRNNYSLTRKVDRDFRIAGKNYSYSFIQTSENIKADSLQLYRADLEKIPSGTGNFANFNVRSWITTDALPESQELRWNDTLRYQQVFADYYAYDDGSAEVGYGLSGEGTNGASFAMRFTEPVEDSLRAVQFYFNRSYKDANQVNFQLAVWGNTEGLPGELLYRDDALNLTPEYSGLNQYYSYQLKELLPLSDTFYIGWIQSNETYLNVGFDLNRVSNNNAFYNIDGSWNASSIAGTVMIRPLIGRVQANLVSKPGVNIPFRLYPNPAQSLIRLEPMGSGLPQNSRLRILNAMGACLLDLAGIPEKIDVSGFSPGVYLLLLDAGSQRLISTKFLIAR